MVFQFNSGIYTKNCIFLKTLKFHSIFHVSLQKRLKHGLIPLKTIPISNLGFSILNIKKNGLSHNSPTDVLRKGVIIAKICSISSSALGIIMIPVINSFLSSKAIENPSTMVFVVLANVLLGILSLTPILLHFLTKRFIVDVYYNPTSSIFTTVHYNFFLQKKALRFKAHDVVDAAIAPESKKLWIPLATCFVHSRPLLLSLDRNQYNNNQIFNLLTKNILIPDKTD